HVLEPFPAGQQRAHSDHEHIEEEMFLGALNTRVFSGLERRDNRRVDRVSHAVCSSPVGSWWEQHSIGGTTGVEVYLGWCDHPAPGMRLEATCIDSKSKLFRVPSKLRLTFDLRFAHF